jgi:MerR family regulatory protein
MLIGELAERAGTSTRTLRYYEQHGLVRARRSANGYRVYDEAELPTLLVFRDGEPVGALVGARPKSALREALSAFTER